MINALHSPSCCFYKNKLYVAFYAGERECVEQKVYIFEKENTSFKKIKELPIGSGNPVLFILDDSLFCCYSMFSRPMIGNVFDLWKTTYTCVEKINTSVEPIDAKRFILSTYCCPRCNPYYSDENVFIPCYDEDIKKGVIFSLTKNRPIERKIIDLNSKYSVIQPSICQIKNNFYVLFRNFHKNLKYYPDKAYALGCPMMFSPAQKDIVFGDTVYTKIPNHNESIVAINDKENNSLIVYNAKAGRTELTLGFLKINNDGIIDVDPIITINEERKGCYPNCCFNDNNQLIISFTSFEEGINSGSQICLTTMSTNYKKILSRKYINGSMLS